MEQAPVYITLLQTVVLPIITAVLGWFGNVFRTRQKKEKDILENVQQILHIQKSYIEEQQSTIVECNNVNKRLEAKLDKKNKSIRRANWCKFTNEGEGCPVLNEEEKQEPAEQACDACKFNEPKS